MLMSDKNYRFVPLLTNLQNPPKSILKTKCSLLPKGKNNSETSNKPLFKLLRILFLFWHEIITKKQKAA